MPRPAGAVLRRRPRGDPVSWDDVLAQPAAVEALRASLLAGEVSHAWLTVGPAGVGQAEVAGALAMALNCPQADAPDGAVAPDVGCGTCSTCARIRRGVHPALVELEPEGAFHVVDAVRNDWIPMASRTLVEGRRRVVRIVAADRMNEAAQNAFLKILEEPPPSVVWLLDVQEEGLLLDTVASRCRRLDLVAWGPPQLEALAERLEVPAPDRAALARAAMGSPQRLRDLADPQVARARLRHLAVVDRLASDGPGQVVPIAKEVVAWSRERAGAARTRHAEEMARLEEAYGAEGGRGWPPGVRQRLTQRFERLERQERRRALDTALDDLASWLRDLLVVAAGVGTRELVNAGHEAELLRDAQRLGPADVVEALRALARCREALERNGSPELQLERLLLALALPLYARAA